MNEIMAFAEEVFILDTDVEVIEESDAGTQDDKPEEILDIPKYETSFTGFLTVPEYSMETGNLVINDSPRPKMSCFNCLGDHNMAECPEPKNYGNINKNRKAHMANRPQSSIRYHEKFNSKYSQFQPGVMSAGLRHALGLRESQVSEMVYRMRLIGYPPGWLMEAREQTGELALFGGNGEAVCQPGGEDGEVTGSAKYKPEKLIDFPGFNTPLPDRFIDEYALYNLPKMRSKHCLEHWKSVMNQNKVTPYRKRKMRPENTGVIDTPSQVEDSTVDMDLECSFENDSSNKRMKRSATPEDGEVLSREVSPVAADVSEGPITFTLDTEPSMVEEDQQAMDKQQCDSKSSSTVANGSSSKRALLSQGSESNGSTFEEEDSSSSNPGTPTISSTPATTGSKKKHHRRAGSKGFVLGAVIPESITPFKELPKADLWTADVTDHLLFENLPDSVGTWDKMRSTMKKVRQKMSKLHEDD